MNKTLRNTILCGLAVSGIVFGTDFTIQKKDEQHREYLQKTVLTIADKNNDGNIDYKELRRLGIDLGILNKEDNIYTSNELVETILNTPEEKYMRYIKSKLRE